MKLILFPFFLSYLLFLDGLFFLELLVAKLAKLKAFLFIGGLVVSQLIFFTHYLDVQQHLALAIQDQSEKKQVDQFNSQINLSQLPTYQVGLETRSLENQVKKYQQLVQKQPHNAAVNLNLALLYHALGKEGLAQEYLQKAQTINPNYSAFGSSAF